MGWNCALKAIYKDSLLVYNDEHLEEEKIEEEKKGKISTCAIGFS